EEDRFGKVAASQNLRNLTVRSIILLADFSMKNTSASKSRKASQREEEYLGDFKIVPQKFENPSRFFKEFQTKEFHRLNDKQKQERVNNALYELIDKAKTPCFLLPAVLGFIEQINALKILESYVFMHFELWLNQ